MSVTLSAGSVVAQPGQQINVASLVDVTAGNNPTYLVVSLLDRSEYTAKSNGETGTLSGNGQTEGFDYLWGDNQTAGIVFTYDAVTGQYTNDTFGDLSTWSIRPRPTPVTAPASRSSPPKTPTSPINTPTIR